MAISAFRLRLQFGRWCFRLMVIEIVISPPAGIGVAFGVLDRDVGAVQSTREIASSGSLCPRAVRILLWQSKLQFLEQDCAFGKSIRLLIDRVCARLHVDVVKLRKICMTAIQRIGSKW